ncbi:MAG: hypothetical protein V3T70_05605 [Phycisphaerae bacterium]
MSLPAPIVQRRSQRALPGVIIAAAAALSAHVATGQSPVGDAQPTEPNLDAGARLLADVEDFTPNFDDAAFYWLIERIRDFDDETHFRVAADEPPVAWSFLTQRPGEFRGQLVRVEGIVESSVGYRIERAGWEDAGAVHQTTLSVDGTPRFFTIISVADDQPAPLRARVRTKGYFLKVHGFMSENGGTGYAPLIVAHHLELLAEPPGRSTTQPGSRLLGGPYAPIWFGTAVLAIVWLLLRRSIRTRPTHRARPDRRRDATASADDFDWLSQRDKNEQQGSHRRLD